MSRDKIRHYRQIYLNRPDPIAFMTVSVDTSDRVYDDFDCKGPVGLILAKVLAMRISIPFDLSSRTFIPLPCFIRSRRPIPLLDPSLVLFPPCCFSVTFFILGSRLFYSDVIKSSFVKNYAYKNVSGKHQIVFGRPNGHLDFVLVQKGSNAKKESFCYMET